MTDAPTFAPGQLVLCTVGAVNWMGHVEAVCPNGCCLRVYQTRLQCEATARDICPGEPESFIAQLVNEACQDTPAQDRSISEIYAAKFFEPVVLQ